MFFFTFYGILKNIRSKEIGKLRFLFPTYLIVTCNCRKKVLRKNSEKGRNWKDWRHFFHGLLLHIHSLLPFPGLNTYIGPIMWGKHCKNRENIFYGKSLHERHIAQSNRLCKKFPHSVIGWLIWGKRGCLGVGVSEWHFFAPKAFTESDRSFSSFLVVVWEIL